MITINYLYKFTWKDGNIVSLENDNNAFSFNVTLEYDAASPLNNSNFDFVLNMPNGLGMQFSALSITGKHSVRLPSKAVLSFPGTGRSIVSVYQYEVDTMNRVTKITVTADGLLAYIYTVTYKA